MPSSPAPEATPWYYRRNALAFTFDMGSFQIAVAFFGAAIVLPSFVATLTKSEVIVGLASGLTTGAWMLPQLLIASYVTRMQRKQPFVARTAWITRPILLVIALAAHLWAVTDPGLTLVITLACIVIFYFFDAVVSVPWFDLMARGLPARRRGRVQGMGQIFGGLGGIGAGFIVRHILSDASPWGFPDNYAWLFIIGSIVMVGSSLAISFIYEPPLEDEERKKTPPSMGQVLASLPQLLGQDRPFLVMIGVRVLAGFVSLATAFYVLYATRRLGFAADSAGFFVSAQILGSVISGLIMGVVQDRWGPRTHMRINVCLSMIPPALALLAGFLMGSPALRLVYMLIYLFLGIYGNSAGWPYFNWVMEHAEERQRPLYIATSNTIGAIFMLAPVLGGWLVSAFSYQAAFVCAIGFAIAAFLVSTRLPCTRKQASC